MTEIVSGTAESWLEPTKQTGIALILELSEPEPCLMIGIETRTVNCNCKQRDKRSQRDKILDWAVNLMHVHIVQ